MRNKIAKLRAEMKNYRFLALAALTILGNLICGSPRTYAAQSLIKQFPVKGNAGSASSSKPGGPTQSQLARKGAFPTIPQAQLAGALDARNLELMNRNIGKTVLCVGVVDKLYTPKKGAMVLINLAPNYKTALVGTVKGRDFGQFPALQNLKGKRVALRGKIVSFKGKPEIELTAPGAIRIVK